MTTTHRFSAVGISILVALGVTFGAAYIGYQTARADGPDYVITVSDHEPVLIAQADTGSAGSAEPGTPDTGAPAAEPSAPAAEPSTPATEVPDPAEQPAEAASLVYRLYKAGHLVPAIILFSFFLLTLLQRWIAWLRTGWRRLAVSATLAGLGMLVERAIEGTTPNMYMLMGALGVALSMVVNAKGEPKEPAAT